MTGTVQIDFGHRSVDVTITQLREWHNNDAAHDDICKALGLKATAPRAGIRELITDIVTQTPGAQEFDCLSCTAATYGADGVVGPELCPECYELAGIDNMLNDDGRLPTDAETDECEGLLTAIHKNGGDCALVRASCDYIWCES